MVLFSLKFPVHTSNYAGASKSFRINNHQVLLIISRRLYFTSVLMLLLSWLPLLLDCCSWFDDFVYINMSECACFFFFFFLTNRKAKRMKWLGG